MQCAFLFKIISLSLHDDTLLLSVHLQNGGIEITKIQLRIHRHCRCEVLVTAMVSISSHAQPCIEERIFL